MLRITSSLLDDQFQGVGPALRATNVVEGAQDQRAYPDEQEALVDADLDTLATALYVHTDDLLKASPERAPRRPKIGIPRRSATPS